MGPVPKIMFPKGFQGAGLKSGAAGTVITFLSLPPETFLNVLYLVGTAPRELLSGTENATGGIRWRLLRVGVVQIRTGS